MANSVNRSMTSAALLFSLLISAGCTGGSGGSPGTATSSPSSNPPSTSGTAPPATPSDSASDSQAPVPHAMSAAGEKANETVSIASCFEDLSKYPVVKDYAAFGTTIEFNCKDLLEAQKNSYFQVQPTDIEENMRVLERVIEEFRSWPNRPKKISIGYRTYHNSKEDMIQLSIRAARPSDVEDYLRDTRLLMDLEISDFNRKVRFSYADYHLGKRPDGSKVDVGSGAIVGYGAARAQLVKDDVAKLRKFKNEILKIQKHFPNVRVTHANQMGSFIVNQWDESYTFPTEYSDVDLKSYFVYLEKLAQAQKSFGDVQLTVNVPSYPQLHIQQAIKAIATAVSAKAAILKTGLRLVQLADPSMVHLTRRFHVERMNGVLIVRNLYTFDGKTETSAALTACLEKANLSTPLARYYCDGRGEERF